MSQNYVSALLSGPSTMEGQIAINATSTPSANTQSTIEQIVETSQEDDTITLKQENGYGENNEALPVDKIIAYLRIHKLLKDCWCVQSVANSQDWLTEIVVHPEVSLQNFSEKLFQSPLVIEGIRFKVTITRGLKKVVKVPLTKVMIYEAPFHLENDLILKKLSQYGQLQDNNMIMYKHKGTDVYTGARSINFTKITKPIPTILFVQGNRVKLRHQNQDRRAICGICKTKGHFRNKCPQLQMIKEFVDLDAEIDDEEPPEFRSWAHARQYVKDREENKRKKRFEEAMKEKEEQMLRQMEENRRKQLEEIEKKQTQKTTAGQKRPNDTDMTESEEGYQTAGEANKKVKPNETANAANAAKPTKKKKKKKSKKKTEVAEMDSDEAGTGKNNQMEQNETVPKSPPSSPYIQDYTSPTSSPYHPDIGESNGTVCGEQPPEESTESESEEEAVIDDNQDEELDLQDATTIPDSYPTLGQHEQYISDSYPTPGQHGQYMSIEQSLDTPDTVKDWAKEMDEVDKV